MTSCSQRSGFEACEGGAARTWRMLPLTARGAMELVLENVVPGNTDQMADPAFATAFQSWIRLNEGEAFRPRDGLFGASSGNPAIPTFLCEVAFGWFFTPEGQNEKYARQIRSAASIAVLICQTGDKPHWFDKGRCYERSAVEATALGIRNAFLNQPVKVETVRSPFAAPIGLAGQQLGAALSFGRGPNLPPSLRRAAQAVLA